MNEEIKKIYKLIDELSNEVKNISCDLKKIENIVFDKKCKWRFEISIFEFFKITGKQLPENCAEKWDELKRIAINYINWRTDHVMLKFGDYNLCKHQIDMLKQALALLIDEICCKGKDILEVNNLISESLGDHSKTWRNETDGISRQVKRLIDDAEIGKIKYSDWRCSIC